MQTEKVKRGRGRPKDSKSSVTVSLASLVAALPAHWNVDVSTAWLKKMGLAIKPVTSDAVVVEAVAAPVIPEADKIDRPDKIKLVPKVFS